MSDYFYILNCDELENAGFKGSFNDLRDEIESRGGEVSGQLSEDDRPSMIVKEMSSVDLGDILSNFGIEDPSQFLDDLDEDDDQFDFDKAMKGDEGDPNPDDPNPDDGDGKGDEGDGDPDPDEGVHLDEEDDDHQDDTHEGEDDPDDPDGDIIDEDDDDDEPHDDDDDVIEITDEFDDEHNEEHEIDGEIYDDRDIYEAITHEHSSTKGLSESTTNAIIDQVIDYGLFKRISARTKTLAEIDKINETIKVPINPWSNVRVNKTEIYKYPNARIAELLNEAKANLKKMRNALTKLNENSQKRTAKKEELEAMFKKQRRLVKLLEAEVVWREMDKSGKMIDFKLLEEFNPGPVISSSDDSSDGSDGFGTGDEGSAQSADDNKPKETEQELTLTSISFKVKDPEAFKQLLVDHGIPEEALEIASTPNDDGSEANPDDQAQTQDQGAAQPMQTPDQMGTGAAPGASANPFEGLVQHGNKLNEDEMPNPFDEGDDASATGDQDQPGDDVDPMNSQDAADAGEAGEVRLTDTKYAAKVREILVDVLHYPAEEFDDKVGKIVDDGSQVEADGSENDGSDDGSEDAEIAGPEAYDKTKDPELVGTRDEIAPEDVFGDL